MMTYSCRVISLTALYPRMNAVAIIARFVTTNVYNDVTISSSDSVPADRRASNIELSGIPSSTPRMR